MFFLSKICVEFVKIWGQYEKTSKESERTMISLRKTRTNRTISVLEYFPFFSCWRELSVFCTERQRKFLRSHWRPSCTTSHNYLYLAVITDTFCPTMAIMLSWLLIDPLPISGSSPSITPQSCVTNDAVVARSYLNFRARATKPTTPSRRVYLASRQRT